jgi:hypothetical protein
LVFVQASITRNTRRMVAIAAATVDINKNKGFISVTPSLLFAKRMRKGMHYADSPPDIRCVLRPVMHTSTTKVSVFTLAGDRNVVNIDLAEHLLELLQIPRTVRRKSSPLVQPPLLTIAHRPTSLFVPLFPYVHYGNL